VFWQAEWLPWGEPAPGSLTSAPALGLRFPGQWFQLETGLHYNWHRHYDPSLGRYTQPDPLGFVDGPSVYGYAGGNPLALVDPEGLQSGTRPFPYPLPPILFPDSPANQKWTKWCLNLYRKYTGGGGGGGGDRKKDDDEQCLEEYNADMRFCWKKMNGERRCLEAAMQRYLACLAGKPTPPWPWQR